MKLLAVIDLMRLVANDSEPQKVVEKAYEWEHLRALEVGKWFLATGTAGFIALATLLSKDEPPTQIIVISLAALSTFVTFTGFGAFWRARHIAARYAKVRALTGEIGEVKTFLQLLRKRGLL